MKLIHSAIPGKDTSTLVGDFFVELWRRYTALKELILSVTVEETGSILLTQYKNNTIFCERKYNLTPGKHIIHLGSIDDLGDRLSCSLLTPFKKEHSFFWSTFSSVILEPKISVVICTFNRPDSVMALLAKLKKQINFLHSIIIINQGDNKIKISKDNFSGQKKILIFDQENFGGAGGFSRGIIEALKDIETTHIQLMDDDVEIDEIFFQRLHSIISYLHPNYCIGGGMTSLSDKKSILSFGHKFNSSKCCSYSFVPDTNERLYGSMVEYAPVDFCGWWSFCFPKVAIKKTGLPLPLFIRGDDLEFGLRLSREGYPTLMWPGIEVSHPDLSSYSQPWHHFYDRRNAFICAYLNTRRIPWKGIFREYRGIINSIVLYDYLNARMGIKSIREFFVSYKRIKDFNLRKYKHIPDVENLDLECDNNFFEKRPIVRTMMVLIRIFRNFFSREYYRANHKRHYIFSFEDWNVGTKIYPVCLYIYKGRGLFFMSLDKKEHFLILKDLIGSLFVIFIHHRKLSVDNLQKLTTISWWEKKLSK